MRVRVILGKHQEDNMSNIAVSDVIKALKVVARKAALARSDSLMGTQVANLVGPDHIAKMASRQYAADDNIMTPAKYVELGNDIARKRFPESRTTAEAVHKWHGTAEGGEYLNAGLRADYERLQKSTALGDGYEAVEKM